MAFHFLLRPDLVIARPVAASAMAMGKPDCPAFLRQARWMDCRRVAAAVCFAVRFSPETDLLAVVLFAVCRRSSGFATAGFVPAADPADSDLATVVVVAVAAVAVADLFDLSAADFSVVAAGPGSVGSAAFAADLACPFCSFAVALGKGRVVAALFYFLTHRSSF